MPLPQISGAYGIHTSTTPYALDISAIPVGAWIIVTAMSATSAMEITEPAGWTVLHTRETTGTRRNFLFGKVKEASDGTTATFTPSAVANTGYTVVWGTGSLDVASWLVGSSGVRSSSGEPAGARYTNTAPGITTTASDSLVLTISHEATNAYVQPKEVTTVSPAGWTEQYWHGQVAANDRIETAWIGTKAMAIPGATGDVTLTYVSPQDNNGWAIQVAIPGGAPVEYDVPTIIGTPTTYITGATTTGFTISRPSGIVDGDYIIVALRSQSSTTTEDPASPGFTRLSFPLVYSSTGNRVNGFYGRPVIDALTEPTDYTFSVTSGTSGRLVATAFIVRGVDVDNPVAGRFESYGGSPITGGRKTTQYALDDVPALSLFLGASEFASPDDHVPLTTPSGYDVASEIVTSTNLGVSRTYLWVGSQQIDTSPTPEASMTWGNPAGYAVDNVSLRGTASTPPPAEGYGLAGLNGNGDEIKMYYTTTEGPRTPSAAMPIRRGFNTVSEALATRGATWAHRGGSVSYPEMSLHAYTQSVVRGYGVLEVSLGRTSDGVWFGLHDQSTDRTSGGTYGNASSQTWAQVQAQQIVTGPGAPQPYMRWEEIVAAYGSTHVLVVDPKYALGSYRTEFLNMVLSDVGTDRAIIKFSGSGSGATGLATAAQGMGFETWGFFYAADASVAQGGNGNLQTWGPYWTTIGMEYGASQAVWNEALALGKPVIGHIAPNQTAYNTAMSKGASAVQVSGVGVVNPVSWWNTLPKTANLIAEYGFAEGSGSSVADLSGNGHTLTVGTGMTWVPGHAGGGLKAADYNSTGAYNSSFTNPTNKVTLMGWAFVQSLGNETPLFGFWDPTPDPDGSSHFNIYASRTTFGPSGVLSACVRFNGTLNTVTGSALSENTWHHIALTYDGTTVTLYLNGEVVQSSVFAGSLGVGQFVTTARGDSITDDVRVFNTALTQNEIKKWMNHAA